MGLSGLGWSFLYIWGPARILQVWMLSWRWPAPVPHSPAEFSTSHRDHGEVCREKWRLKTSWAYLQNWHRITAFASHQPTQVTPPAQSQEVGKQALSFVGYLVWVYKILNFISNIAEKAKQIPEEVYLLMGSCLKTHFKGAEKLERKFLKLFSKLPPDAWFWHLP